MELNSKELIKVLLNRRGIFQKDLVKALAEKTGRVYTPDSFSQRMRRGSLTYDEILEIIKILGYEIQIVDTEKIDET